MFYKFKLFLMLAFLAQIAYAAAPDGMETVLKLYKVKRGDTFYKIADSFYNDPSRWKEIWDYNKYVKKSHWIFPGDMLIVPTYRKKVVKQKEAKPEEETAKAPKAVETTPDELIAPYYSDMTPPLDFKYDGKIAAFVANDAIQAQYARVVLDFGSDKGAAINKTYDIYRSIHVIKNPDTKDIIGMLIKKIGRVTVTEGLQKNSSIAIIDDAAGSLKTGDFVRAIPEKK